MALTERHIMITLALCYHYSQKEEQYDDDMTPFHSKNVCGGKARIMVQRPMLRAMISIPLSVVVGR